jgi:hypothetical protein
VEKQTTTTDAPPTLSRRFTEAHRCFTDGIEEGCIVSDQPSDKPLTGLARSLANLKRYPKGQTGNPSGRTKELARFGDILMREFYKTVPANLDGKTINKQQGEIIAMQMVKNAINKGPVAQKLVLQCIVEREARLAPPREAASQEAGRRIGGDRLGRAKRRAGMTAVGINEVQARISELVGGIFWTPILVTTFERQGA